MLNSIRESLASVRDRVEGATAVEYAVMVALIAAVIVIAVIALGNNAKDTFQETADCIADTATC